jgi:hypothetical protein
MLLTLSGFKVPTRAGTYRWRSLWTPYVPGTANVNTAGSVEAQSIVAIPPGSLTISATKKMVTVKGSSRSQVMLSGKLLIGGEPARNYIVAFSHGRNGTKLVALGSTKTTVTGDYRISSRIRQPSFFQAGVTIARQDLGPAGCEPSFGAGITCVHATIGGSHLLSKLIRITP